MDSYIEGVPAVNVEVDPVEIEIPAFLSRRSAQAPSCKPRRRLSPECWGRINAAIARERQLLALLAPASPRVRPTLPRLPPEVA